MVKVNLLDLPEETRIKPDKDRQEDDTAEVSPRSKRPPREEITFFPREEEPPAATDTQRKPFFMDDDDPPPRPNPFLSGENEFNEEAEPESGEEPVVLDEPFPRSRLIIILGAIGIILLAAFIYLWIGPGDSPVTADDPLTATDPSGITDGVRPPTLPENMLPAPVQQQLNLNLAENRFHINYAERFLTSASPSSDYALFVVTSGHLFISTIADSRDAVAEYRQKIKGIFPGIQLNIESTEDKYLGNQKKLMADFSVPISTSGFDTGRESFTGTQDANGLRERIQALAEQNGLNTVYYKKGDEERNSGFQKSYYYADVTGNRSGVTDFLRELSAQYPEINFSKVAIYPAGGATIGSQNVKTHIEMIFYSPTGV